MIDRPAPLKEEKKNTASGNEGIEGIGHDGVQGNDESIKEEAQTSPMEDGSDFHMFK